MSEKSAETKTQTHRPTIDDLHLQIESLLDEQLFDQVKVMLSDLHPGEIADLIPGFGALYRNQIFDLVSVEMRHEVLAELEEIDQEDQLERMTDNQVADVIDKLESDDAADIVALLDDEQRERVLAATPEEDREEVVQLLEFDEESAGGLMAVELVTVRSNQTVHDAVEAIREARDKGFDDIHYVHVVNGGNKLIGRAEILDIMLAARNTPITSILDEDIVSVNSDLDQERVARIFQRHDLISAPVVDEDGRLIGKITIDDIVDVIHEEAEEDITRLSGSGDQEVSERNIFKIIKARLPWLVVAFLGELLSSAVLAGYEEKLKALIIISFFIPVVIAVAGNVGVQASTIVVRGLATGEISAHQSFKRIFQELLVGLLNGTVISLIFMGVIMLWKGDLHVAIAVSLSLIFVVIIAAFTGSMIPFVLKRFNQDPANASGPFITMVNDVFGLLVYMIVTTSILM